MLHIDTTVYLLSPVRQDRHACKKHKIQDRPVIGYRLVKANATVYDLYPRPHGWECNCGNAVFARGSAPTAELRACKHVRCVLAALPVAGLPVPTAIETRDPLLSDAPGCDGDGFAYDGLDTL